MENAATYQEINDRTEAFADHIPFLKSVARRYVRSGEDVEDLVQDTLVLALRFAHTYKESLNMKAWLCRVMKNRFISITRRRKLERNTMEKEACHSMLEWSVSEASRRNRKRDGGIECSLPLPGALENAIDTLRPEYKQAVVLCDLEGMTYEEAAAVEECPVGTIMSRLHRGRRSLRKKLSWEHREAA